jgi:alpha,alpha-trehalase
MPTLKPTLDTDVLLPVADHDAVIFDMDGVVTDTTEVHRLAWAAMFDAYLQHAEIRTGRLQQPFGLDDYQRYVDGKHRDDGVRDFLAARGIHLSDGTPDDPVEAETVWGLANRKNAAFQETLAEHGVQVFPSTVHLVRALQAHGIGTAIISASRNCRRVLEAAGVGDLFSVRVDGSESARLGLPGKPDPAVFLEAARRLGAHPGRSVVVEDAVAGVQAGRAGHFGLVVGVDRGGHAAELRREGAHVVVDDLAAVRLTA